MVRKALQSAGFCHVRGHETLLVLAPHVTIGLTLADACGFVASLTAPPALQCSHPHHFGLFEPIDAPAPASPRHKVAPGSSYMTMHYSIYRPQQELSGAKVEHNTFPSSLHLLFIEVRKHRDWGGWDGDLEEGGEGAQLGPTGLANQVHLLRVAPIVRDLLHHPVDACVHVLQHVDNGTLYQTQSTLSDAGTGLTQYCAAPTYVYCKSHRSTRT